MDLNNDHIEENMTVVSVLQGDGFCVSRILSRESSVGQSSRIYYRSAEGIPFKWELQPGTPKTPQEDDIVPPPSPSPLMQSLGLPLPNVDPDKPQGSSTKALKIRNLKEMVKKRINSDVTKVEMMLGRKGKHMKERPNGEALPAAKDLSVSSVSTSSLSDSSFSSNSRALDSSMMDASFCCSPWSVPAVLVEGKTRIYYCSHHGTSYSVGEDGSFLTRSHTRFPASADQYFPGALQDEIPLAPAAGVPFRWESQPGTPKRPLENELIPPPSPPPAAQSMALRQLRPQRGKTEKPAWTSSAWNWLREKKKKKKKKQQKNESEISLRCGGNMRNYSSSDEEFEGSVVSEKTMKSSLRRSSNLRCGYWNRREVLAFTWKKFKSLTS